MKIWFRKLICGNFNWIGNALSKPMTGLIESSPVPVQSLLVVPVKEMWLIPNGSHVWVHPESLQQGSGAPFLHPDYNGLGKFLLPVIRSAVHPGFAVRGADLLVLPLRRGGAKRRRRFSWRRLRSNPLHCPLFVFILLPYRWSRGCSLSLCEFREGWRSRVKFLPQCHKSCILCHQPALKHIVFL